MPIIDEKVSRLNPSSGDFGPVTLIAGCTRWLQARFPQRPIKGLTRFSNFLSRWLPAYRGVIQLGGGIRMVVDSNQAAERWLLYSGNYQPALTFILQQHSPPGGYCLDIGANLGFYTIKFGQWVGGTGYVAAFEANAAMVERIQDNVALNGFSQVTVVSAAVHSQPGQVEFFVSSDPGKSSVNQIDKATKKIVVPAIVIDEYVSEHHLPRLDVIKMDIEGNDCNALLGAVNTLTHFRPFLVFEYKNTTPPEIADRAFSLLADLDYQLYSLSRNGEQLRFDWKTSRLTQTDIICIPADRKGR